jgi:TPR repeat protein
MRALIATVCCALPISAYATVAATSEQILCNSAQIVVADVISGSSGDCRLRAGPGWCSPHDIGRLKVRIVEVLAVGADSKFRVFGAAMENGKLTEAPHEVRSTPVVENQVVAVSVRTSAPIDVALTDGQVDERFRGKRLLLSISFGGGVLPLLENQAGERGVEKRPPTILPSGSNLYAEIWPVERREWVEKTIVVPHGLDCPKAVVNDGHSAVTYKPPVAEADIIAEALRLGPADSYTLREIGDWYYNGDHGLRKSPADAVTWYLKAAEQGNDLALRKLGEMFEFGEGVAPDHEKALEWIRKADALVPGSGLWSGLAIARKHEGGRGFPKNLQRAEEWYRLSADKGYVEAQNALGEFYEACGKPADAAHWYRKAAESVSPSAAHSKANSAASNAMSHLGKLYATGEGVVQNYAEAAMWYQRSIDSGGYSGQRGLAALYERGLGIPQDINRALELYYDAAPVDEEARRRLFALYEVGMNVPEDDGKALQWYRAAAEKGDVRAQVGLGLRYKFHKGVDANWAVAYALFNLGKLSRSAGRRHVPDFTGPAEAANTWMAPATWKLVHEMAKPGNLLRALDEFIAHHRPGKAFDVSGLSSRPGLNGCGCDYSRSPAAEASRGAPYGTPGEVRTS